MVQNKDKLREASNKYRSEDKYHIKEANNKYQADGKDKLRTSAMKAETRIKHNLRQRHDTSKDNVPSVILQNQAHQQPQNTLR